MAGLKLYKDAAGNKLYPVCKWEPNQHKLHNAVDRAYLQMIDTEYDERACDEYERVEKLLEAFDRHIINGLVYATYEDGKAIKDIVVAYDIRVDFQ